MSRTLTPWRSTLCGQHARADARVECLDDFENCLGDVGEEGGRDGLEVIRGLVVVPVVFDAEVEERDIGLLEGLLV